MASTPTWARSKAGFLAALGRTGKAGFLPSVEMTNKKSLNDGKSAEMKAKATEGQGNGEKLKIDK